MDHFLNKINVISCWRVDKKEGGEWIDENIHEVDVSADLYLNKDQHFSTTKKKNKFNYLYASILSKSILLIIIINYTISFITYAFWSSILTPFSWAILLIFPLFCKMECP